ncbi:amino acid ABC transporter permease [Paraburkholderia caballeronis]|uniref:Amino acid ABC transporter membrane protein 1, PAAT family n=1 Tax=Paraburkholderia caballeronis TaxID=416943 RepID=A0A1H7QJL5_9BURK|nr:amino acid ABC transporter permease [Paraburkholderia caballeronis]PXW22521.1 amino acid ABC transporter membrane protein 1 (PAAT family) [Paraburkholderia caballeronis]PXW96392.1 amino acid ABC transporter membrane protein 1 (PAAT family) [Paraburkholderia caballeronis]RAJ92803.1 amino acid ABC transporter membrane protein 1 (PAAT family) [Paraburkholderia caballeronis]TDV15037.1 amino acid ABC transporter membrane protein 1 (PAAT family) [Paraburkholderia caballeronis]TDV16838.1 amino aci
MFSLNAFLDGLPLLLHAALMTVGVSAAGLVLGFFVGLAVCSARLSAWRALRIAADLYVRVFRGIPMLVQLLLVYYLLPFVGINVSPLVAAIGTMSLCSAAYVAEILRGGFVTLPPGQIEAARMLGFSSLDRLWRIEVPQVVRATLPLLVNEMVLLIKASSLISVVGVAEITRTAQNIAASTYQPLEAYTAAGLIYFVICGTLALFVHAAERRLNAA